MYGLPDNGLSVQMLTYSVSIDAIVQPDAPLIQLSILSKISWIDLSRLYLGPITVLLVK